MFALGLFGASAATAIAAQETRNVLVLYGNVRQLPANLKLDQGLRQALLSSPARPVAVFEEFLDVARFSGDLYADTVATYLRGKYASNPPAVIIVGNEPALTFLLANRERLFPRAPVVHISVSRSFLQSHPPLAADIVGVPIEHDVGGTIDQALRWHSRARRLVVVTGASPRDRVWEARLRTEVPRVAQNMGTEFLAGLPTGELLARLAALGKDSVVFTTGYFQDGDGRVFTPRESVEGIAGAATAPVYAPFDTFIGTGIVGGRMPSYEAMGRQAGQIVNALLDGASPASLRLPEVMPTALNVDWRQARRWGIAERLIPADAVVHFRTPTFWEQYRYGAIAVAVVILLQGGLVGGLLLERRRRRGAELSVQRQRSELAHASRLAIAGELTGSIAHEINQPLGAILSNADAADLILESGGDRRVEVRQILADIRRDDLRASEVIRRLRTLLAKHEVERIPFDLNELVSDVAAVLGVEARHRGVSLDIRPVQTAAPVIGDRVQFQQVLINLVLNAMDAVAEAPETLRWVSVSIDRSANGIILSVRDKGQGIAAEHLPKLFDSFFTTKRSGMGLGLSIARTIVEAHGGRIWAESSPGGGAVFRVELPADPGTGTAINTAGRPQTVPT